MTVVLRAQLPAYAAELFRPHRYKVLWGGRAGTRSWTVARALLIKAASKPLRILCTREFQASISASVHQLLKDQIALLGLDGFEITDREIRHACGSQFLFEGLRYNIGKIKSLEGIDICWVEEAEFITDASWKVLVPTIRKEDSEIWVTFNPDEETDATYQRFVANPPPDTWVHHSTSWDNPWLTRELEAERDYAYKVDPDSADHVWGGQCRKISHAQILKGKWFVEEFEPGEGWQGPYQGADFGFSEDPAAAIRAYVHERVLYVRNEMYRFHLEIDHYKGATVTSIPDFDRYVTRADSSRPDSISYLRRHGLPRIVGAKKGPNSIEDGIAHLRSYERIVIHPSCKHFQDEAKHYSYEVDEKSGDVLPDIIDKWNHLMDSLRYAVEPLIKPKRRVGLVFAGSVSK